MKLFNLKKKNTQTDTQIQVTIDSDFERESDAILNKQDYIKITLDSLDFKATGTFYTDKIELISKELGQYKLIGILEVDGMEYFDEKTGSDFDMDDYIKENGGATETEYKSSWSDFNPLAR